MTDTPGWVSNKGEGVQFGGGEPAPDDRATYQTIDVVAEMAWETHRSWERIIGENVKTHWEMLPPGDKAKVIASVTWLIDHPTSSLIAQHDAWRALRMGRIGTEIVDDDSHPNMVPFDELPFSQQMKARLWRHIIFAVLG